MSDDSRVRPPTSFAQRFVRYVGGFGVGVGLGLAPFLGKLPVPGFEALLRLFPQELQSTVIPLSAFLMGLVAVASQFYSEESMTRVAIRRRFGFVLIFLSVGLLVLIVLHNVFVISVPMLSGDVNMSVTIAGERLGQCDCDPTLSDTECVKEITLSGVDSCWDQGKRRRASLFMGLSYLWVTTSFAALVGLLMIQERLLRRAASRRRGKDRR